MDWQELKGKIKDALPKQHPVHKAIQEYEDPNRSQSIEQTFNHLFDLLDDWGRGLRDWDEVEEGITDVKRRLELDQAVS